MTDSSVPTDRPQPMSFDPIFRKLYSKLRARQRPDGSFPRWIMALPMGLTYSRIGLMPVAVWFGYAARHQQTGSGIAALVLIILLLFTDTFDGGIARATNNVSRKGARIDPAIDKVAEIFIFGSWIWATAKLFPALYPWFLWLFIVRAVLEAMLTVVAGLGEKRGLEGRSGTMGKMKFNWDCLAFLLGGISLLSGTSWLMGVTIAIVVITLPYAVLTVREHVLLLRY